MGLSNELSYEAGSFSHCLFNPHRCFESELEALFPHAGDLGSTVCLAPLLFLPVYLCANVRSQGLLVVTLPAPFIPQSTSLWVPPCCHESYLSWLPVSTPPTGLDECFFFITEVVGLPRGSIFCQFWLFFVFKLLLSFFWLCEEVQRVYLHLHLGWKLYVLIF